MKRSPDSGEYAGCAQPFASGPIYTKGDRVRVKATGKLGTVQYAINTARGHFVTVSLDDEDGRKRQLTAGAIQRVESLF